MAIASLAASTTSLSLARLAATIRPADRDGDSDDARPSAAASPADTSAVGAPASATAQTPDDALGAAAALLDKLDAALEALRDGRRGHGHGRRIGYDRRGALADGHSGGQTLPAPSSRPTGGAAALTAATAERTEITIGPDGIGYSKASLSVGHLATDTGTVDVVSLSVTRAYLGFGTPAPAGRTATSA